MTKINFTSLALCAAMLSFGFAKNTDHIYANHTQICNAIDKKQIDNIYTLSLEDGTVKDNILYFDVTRQGIPHLTDFSLDCIDGTYEFTCKYGKLILKGSFISNDGDKYLNYVNYSIYVDEIFDPDFRNLTEQEINNPEYQRFLDVSYSTYGKNSGDLWLCRYDNQKLSLQAYQNRLRRYALSMEEVTAISKEIIKKANREMNFQLTFTEDDKEFFINRIKDIRDGINSRRFEKEAEKMRRIFYRIPRR